MAKRGENIYHRKDGRWEGRYIKGRKPDGKPRFGSVYGRSYGEVKKRLLPLKAAYYETGPETRNTKPFREYLLTNLAQKRTGCIKASSYDSYYRIVHNHIMPGLGNHLMHRLTQQYVEQFLVDLRNAGLSDGTVLNIFRYLAGVTRQAAKSGAMAKDVCAEILLPKPKRKKVSALSRAQQKSLEDAAMAAIRRSGGNQGVDVMIALYTGMRVGEICALRWSDVDFDSGIIHVRQTLQRLSLHDQDIKTNTKTAIMVDAPKSESSLRAIPMGALLLSLMLDCRRSVHGNYVVAGHHGAAEPRTLQYRLERMLEQAQLPHVGYHALRHSFATRCVELNVDIATISKLLGHASIKLTADTYVDSFMEQRFAAAHKLDGLAIAA